MSMTFYLINSTHECLTHVVVQAQAQTIKDTKQFFASPEKSWNRRYTLLIWSWRRVYLHVSTLHRHVNRVHLQFVRFHLQVAGVYRQVARVYLKIARVHLQMARVYYNVSHIKSIFRCLVSFYMCLELFSICLVSRILFFLLVLNPLKYSN